MQLKFKKLTSPNKKHTQEHPLKKEKKRKNETKPRKKKSRWEKKKKKKKKTDKAVDKKKEKKGRDESHRSACDRGWKNKQTTNPQNKQTNKQQQQHKNTRWKKGKKDATNQPPPPPPQKKVRKERRKNNYNQPIKNKERTSSWLWTPWLKNLSGVTSSQPGELLKPGRKMVLWRLLERALLSGNVGVCV